MDHLPGESVIEKERVMRPNVKNDLRPIVDDLLKAGILRLVDKQGNFLSNCHGISKPGKILHITGKAETTARARYKPFKANFGLEKS